MKRQNGEGTCRFDETQRRYEFKITYTDPITNKAKRKTFTSTKSRAEAMRKAKKFKDSLCISTTQQPKVFTLSTWLDQWIENIAKTVKPKTLERYKCLINVNIKPYGLANEVLSAEPWRRRAQHLWCKWPYSYTRHYSRQGRQTFFLP